MLHADGAASDARSQGDLHVHEFVGCRDNLEVRVRCSPKGCTVGGCIMSAFLPVSSHWLHLKVSLRFQQLMERRHSAGAGVQRPRSGLCLAPVLNVTHSLRAHTPMHHKPPRHHRVQVTTPRGSLDGME
jgi:hypothetical protein